MDPKVISLPSTTSNYTKGVYSPYTFAAMDSLGPLGSNGTLEGPMVTPDFVFTVTFLLGCFLIVAVIFGNVIICIIFCANSKLHVLTNYWIISLSATDLLLGTIVMPIAVTTLATDQLWMFGSIFCDIFISLDILCCTCSIYHLVIISLDRYFCVKFPLQYIHKRTKYRILFVLFCVWAWCTILSTTRMLFFTNDNRKPLICKMTNSSYIVFSSVISFYLPMIVIMTTYGAMYRATQHRSKLITTKYLNKKVTEMTGNVKRISRRLSQRASSSRRRRQCSPAGREDDTETAKVHLTSQLLPSTRDMRNNSTVVETNQCRSEVIPLPENCEDNQSETPDRALDAGVNETVQTSIEAAAPVTDASPRTKSESGLDQENKTSLSSQSFLVPEVTVISNGHYHDNNNIQRFVDDSPKSNGVSNGNSNDHNDDGTNNTDNYDDNSSGQHNVVTFTVDDRSETTASGLNVISDTADTDLGPCIINCSVSIREHASDVCNENSGDSETHNGDIINVDICCRRDTPEDDNNNIKAIDDIHDNIPICITIDASSNCEDFDNIEIFDQIPDSVVQVPCHKPTKPNITISDLDQQDPHDCTCSSSLLAPPSELTVRPSVLPPPACQKRAGPSLSVPLHSAAATIRRSIKRRIKSVDRTSSTQSSGSPSTGGGGVGSLDFAPKASGPPVISIVPQVIITEDSGRHHPEAVEIVYDDTPNSGTGAGSNTAVGSNTLRPEGGETKKPPRRRKTSSAARQRSSVCAPATVGNGTLLEVSAIGEDGQDRKNGIHLLGVPGEKTSCVFEETSTSSSLDSNSEDNEEGLNVAKQLLDIPDYDVVPKNPRKSALGVLVRRAAQSHNSLLAALTGIDQSGNPVKKPSFLRSKESAEDRLRKISRLERSRQRQERRAGKVILIVISAFVVCWAPFFVVNLASPFCAHTCIPRSVWTFVTWLGYANSALNPMIYTAFNRTFRTAMLELFQAGKKKSSIFTGIRLTTTAASPAAMGVIRIALAPPTPPNNASAVTAEVTAFR